VAKTKSRGSTTSGKDSKPKYLGVKIADGEKARPGMIIVKQIGTKFLPGKNVKVGRDHSLYAMKQGVVRFQTKRVVKFDKRQRIAKIVSVE